MDRGSQTGLFVLWPYARGVERRILADLRQRFTVRRVFEVHWTTRRVRRNYERFYSDLEVRGVYHLLNKGAGPFLAAVIEDRSPVLEPRTTSRGLRTVNARFVDAKSAYRDWLGGLGVHCGETQWETRRDLTMLLGSERSDGLLLGQADWNGHIEVLHRDVSGADGWPSEGEMLRALADGADYVLLERADDSPTAFAPGGPQPQILVGQYHTAHTILDARALRWSPSPHGGRFAVRVAGRRIVVGLRFAGDGFLDEGFARGCLERRVLDSRGYYCLAPLDALAVTAYRTLYHSTRSDPGELQRLAESARELGLEGWSPESLSDPTRVRDLLEACGSCPLPRPVRPRDTSVYFDMRGGRAGSTRRLLGRLRRSLCSAGAGVGGLVSYCYLAARDRLVLAAPWLRRLRASVRRRSPLGQSEAAR